MKTVFAGPSVYGAEIDWSGLDRRGPARCGDFLKAVRDGSSVIGLIDGYFEGGISVWHKEILFALSSGVKVFGASSMGALRAAECAAFGMRPVGKIAEAFASGDLIADADVAVQHGPEELGCPPVTLAMVDVRATIERMLERGLIGAADEDAVLRAAEGMFFKHRTVARLFKEAGGNFELQQDFNASFFSQKTADAMLLIAQVRAEADERQTSALAFEFCPSPQWQALSGSTFAQNAH